MLVGQIDLVGLERIQIGVTAVTADDTGVAIHVDGVSGTEIKQIGPGNDTRRCETHDVLIRKLEGKVHRRQELVVVRLDEDGLDAAVQNRV